jgi:hypothetical protein
VWLPVRRIVATITPLWVEIHYLKKMRSRRARRRVPLFEMVAGVRRLSTSVPATPWTEIGGFTTRWGLLVALLAAGGLLTVSELREALARARPRAHPAVS